jgi:glutathione synthase/RimK-type ligase-like ATP-grasp enzyme/aminoglycoside phosphotransferase (APT) family kinase protein
VKVCLLTDTPEHPLLAAFSDLLGGRHDIVVVNASSGAGPENRDPSAEMYLLKSHTSQALALARVAESRGGKVINSAAATGLCQDRLRMAARARSLGLPFPDTHYLAWLSDLGAWLAGSAAPNPPVVVKSRTSRRQDLVTRLNRAACLRSLEVDWGEEPIVVQDFIPGDGWDYKLWVIGSRVFAGMRRSPLDSGVPVTIRSLDPRRLPPDWLDLTRTVGDAFDLQIYGVDILDTARGPVIVDVNAFPGFRGIAEAPEALAAFVLRNGTATVASRGASRPGRSVPEPAEQRQTAATAPVAALHHAVSGLIAVLERTGDDGSGRDPAGLRAVSVRRKPRRGLTVSYRRNDRRSTGAPRQLVTARLSESALRDPRIGERLASAAPAEFGGRWPGIVCCPRLGLSVQSFPYDVDLPVLPAALATSPLAGPLATALTAAVRAVLGDPCASVAEVRVSPVRYKPGSRCVLRYQVRSAAAEDLVFFGKLYSDPADATVAYELARRLWAALDRPRSSQRPNAPSVPPVVPRPLALVEEMSLVLTEVAGGAHDGGQVTGSTLLRPSRRSRSRADPPCAALAASAAALAWMHTSRVTAERYAPSGSVYAARVGEWSRALADTVPELGDRLDRLARLLNDALARTEAGSPVLIHGAFKPSQLVFRAPDQPVITDLDGAGLGDPALDVGYFLAYLRPPGLDDRDGGGIRAWYTAARHTFLGAYLAALASHGVEPDHLAAQQRRSAVFEAALLLKIASRRTRRVGSPRSAEARAAVAQIGLCLDRFTGGREA